MLRPLSSGVWTIAPAETQLLPKDPLSPGDRYWVALIRDTDYVSCVIGSFRDKKTAAVYCGRLPKGFPPDLLSAARRKLGYLHAATSMDDLRLPPGNRLEALVGDRDRQYSIRINDQWRLCFVWKDGTAEDVEIVDYH